jgi:hypothetical protein
MTVAAERDDHGGLWTIISFAAGEGEIEYRLIGHSNCRPNRIA